MWGPLSSVLRKQTVRATFARWIGPGSSQCWAGAGKSDPEIFFQYLIPFPI
jgi:hypothetical protein